MKLLEGKVISKVYHLADLHIRNIKRHGEYRKVFKQFLSNVKEDGFKDAIIYIGGDIAHAKTEMSPELIREVSWFLSECAKLHPTFVITGNHDCNMNNMSRLDVLTPIIENLNNPNLHYLRDTGVYEVGNLHIGVYSLFSDKSDWPKGSDVVGENKICFFHGPIYNSQTDVGYTVSSRTFPVDIFDGWHTVLLGDIHKRQTLQQYDPQNGKPIVAYASSMVQQNHGELIEGHGYLLWDVPSRSFTEFDLHNDYGYITIDILDGEIPQWVYDEVGTKLPKHPKIRARFTKTDPSKVKEVLIELRQLFSATEITVTRTDTIGQLKGHNRYNTSVIGNVKDVDFQATLIRDYLERHFYLDDGEIQKVLDINRTTNQSVVDTENIGTIVWIPKKFEFSNMFSYGEDNKIDFSKANGIVGVFAPNASGKSSVFDAISFCLFDKCSRAFKAQNVMNNRKDDFRCKFNFEIDGVDYFIERTAVRQRGGNVKVDVDFWRKKDGVVENLNGEQRRNTDAIIEQYLGKYEDFVLTALSLQGNNALFIDKSQSERKDILSQFIGVDVFDKLYNIASEHNKETSTLIKRFKNDDFTTNLVQLQDTLETLTEEYGEIHSELDGLKSEETKLNDGVISNTSKLVTLTANIRGVDEIERDTIAGERELGQLTEASASLSEKLGKYSDLKLDIDRLIQTHFVGVVETHKEYGELLIIQKDVTHILEKLELKEKSLESSLKHLSEHEYNPDCSICLKNSDSVIRNKETVEGELTNIRAEIQKQTQSKQRLDDRVSELSPIVKRWAEWNSTMEKKRKLDEAISDTERGLASNDSTSFRVKTKLEKLEEELSDYYKFELDYKTNKEQNRIISGLKGELDGVRRNIGVVEKRLLQKNGDKSSTEREIQLLKDKIEEVRKLEADHKSYEYYLDAVKRDGISYELISKIIPIIEGEVNNILAQMVDFGMQLEMDGKNINAYLIYSDQQWPLEMSSGMERFISGLAIRVALINVCNLPRPNFLVVDEGFGSLDSENMTSMFMMFNYLKTQFDFVMVISHIDSMRDIVDQLIEIKKANGFSQLRF